MIGEVKEIFEYDSLARLDKWSVTEKGSKKSVLSFGYDDDGNLLDQTVVQGRGPAVGNSYTDQSGHPHAIKTLTSGGQTGNFTYDNGGRQKTGPGRTVDYTWFNLPSRVVQGTRQTTFQYDAFERRTVKETTNGDQIYLRQ